MMLLQWYLHDGADFQTRAVLACLQAEFEMGCLPHRGIYFEVRISRWEDGRRHGYVVYSQLNGKGINIAFFNDENNDDIVVYQWEGHYLNPPNVNDLPLGKIKSSSFDLNLQNHQVVAKHIMQQLKSWIFQ